MNWTSLFDFNETMVTHLFRYETHLLVRMNLIFDAIN